MKESQIRNYLKANGFEKMLFENSLTFYHRNGIYTYIDRGIKCLTVMKDIEHFEDLELFNLDEIRLIDYNEMGLEIITYCPILKKREGKIFLSDKT